MKYKSFNEAIDKLQMFSTYLNYDTMKSMIQFVSSLYDIDTYYIEENIDWRD